MSTIRFLQGSRRQLSLNSGFQRYKSPTPQAKSSLITPSKSILIIHILVMKGLFSLVFATLALLQVTVAAPVVEAGKFSRSQYIVCRPVKIYAGGVVERADVAGTFLVPAWFSNVLFNRLST